MALTDIAANGIASITGSIAKAQIRICDNRKEWDSATIKMNDAITTGGGGLSKFAGAYAGKGGVSGFAGTVAGGIDSLGSKAAGALDSVTGGKLGMSSVTNLKNALDSGYNKVFEVQFNPSSLSLSARGGGTRFDTDHSAGKISQSSDDKVFISMSVKLIFNKVDNNTCFPSDSMNMSISNVANTAVKGVKKLFTDGGPSVQTTVEGFIGAVRDPNTTKVCFAWGDLRYEGVLRNVNATYTMFDPAGRPVAATVNLSLYLADEGVSNQTAIQLGGWQNAYEKAFSSSTSYVGTAQKMLRSVAKFIP